MTVAVAIILTIVVTLAAVAGSGILWPQHVMRAALWADRLDGHGPGYNPPVKPQNPGVPSGRHTRSVPLTGASPAAAPAAVPDPLTHPGRPPLEDRAPWGDVDQPVGWPVFTTSTDMKPVVDGRVVPPYMLRGEDR
jgi:hypothetical protein